MKQLQAIKGHSYGHKFRNPGDVYEAVDRDANLMVILKNSKYYAAPKQAQSVAEKAAKEKPAEEKPKRPYVRRNLAANPSGSYSTKDMKAE